MEKLHFLVDWREDDKTKTWSGTCWGLFTALQRHYKIEEINTYNYRKIDFIIKVLVKLRIIRRDRLNIRKIKFVRSLILPKLRKAKHPLVFQFQEYIPNQENVSAYIYLDLTLSYLRYMYSNSPETFLTSNFEDCDLQTIERRLCMQSDFFKTMSGMFCMGYWLKEFMTENGDVSSNKVHVVGGGINLNVKDFKVSKKDNNKILFVGRDFKRKGGFLVYEAFVLLKKLRPDAELYVAGPSNDPIASSIDGYYYLGDLPNSALAEYFNKCDIFCMPSYFEAYGLVFIEALCYGLPCIGRNCYEMPYFIEEGKTGFLIDDDNAMELAKKMMILLENDTIKSNVKSRRDWYLKNYSWDAVAERIHNIISESAARPN